MTAAASRNPRDLDATSREIAETLARKSGLSLADWIASLMGGEVEAARAIQSERAPRPQEAPAHPADAPGGLLRAVKTLADRIEAIERRSSSAAAGTDETVQAAIARLVEVGREQVAVAARFEGAVSEIGAEQARMADRLRRIESEGTGPRSAEALRALEANLGKMAGHLYEGEGRTREAIEEIGAKLRRVEVGQSAQPSRLADTVAVLARRLEDAEARTREAMGRLAESLAAMDGRLEGVEVASLGAASADRLSEIEIHNSEIRREVGESLATVGQRLNGLQEVARAAAPAARLEESESRTTGALADLDARVTDLDARSATALGELGRTLDDMDERMGGLERSVGATVTAEALDDLTRDVFERVDAARAQSAERLDGLERGVAELGDTIEGAQQRSHEAIAASEQRSREAITVMGREVVDLSESLVRRVQAAEHRTAEAVEQMGGEVSRIVDTVEARLGQADSAQAHALERLGDEIARISERLAERIATADRRSAQAIEEVGDQMARVTERLSQRQERTGEDLAERIRLSEERTTRVLQETRVEIERMGQARRRAADAAAFAGPGDDEQEPLFGEDPFSGFSPPPAAPEALAARPTFSQEDLDLADSLASKDDADHPAPEDDADELVPWGHDLAEATQIPTPAPGWASRDETDETQEPTSPNWSRPPPPVDAVASVDWPDDDIPPASEPSLTIREAVEKARAATLASPGSPRTTFGSRTADGALFPKSALGAARRTSAAPAALGLGLAAAFGLALGGFWYIERENPGPIDRYLPNASPAPSPTARAAGGAASSALPRMALALAPTDVGASAHPLASGEDLPQVYDGALARLSAHDPQGLIDLRRVASLGYPPAQFYLAKLYESGAEGMKADPVLARMWTQRAAEGGNARAMHNLALDFYEGTGGPRSTSDAARWFAKAAALGVADSQYNLGLFYEEGHGVSQNPAEAYKWDLIAARSGDSDSRASAERVKALLSPEARSAAERSAAAFRPAQAMPASKVAGAPNVVVSAQKALAALGYYQGPTDGAASPALRLALSAYQRAQGLPVTGAPDPVTLAKLQTPEQPSSDQ
jgi:localization factor PodJL